MSEQRPARSSSDNSRGAHSSGSDGNNRGSKPARTAQPSPTALARRAAAELGELLGREPEGVISLERNDDGWRLGIEVVEVRRIPETADVLAEYEVDVDTRGRLVGYRRARRYARGQVRDDR